MSTTTTTHTGNLSLDFLSDAKKEFGSNAKNRLAQNAVTNSKWGDILINRDELQRLNPPGNSLTFSTKLLPEMKITSQKSSGRCWIFAALNWFRRDVVAKYNLGDNFELSQPHLFFYDKLEKCNYFLESILETLNEPLDGRLVQHLLSDMTNDGGQWDMLVNLINKYGIMPKSAYSESEATQASFPMNKLLKSKLREFAQQLRSKHENNKMSEAELRQEKANMMRIIYRILCIHLGTPPASFDFTVHDKDKKLLSFPNLTPLQFVKDHISVDVNDYVSVVNDPRNPYERTMTVDKLGNVVGGKEVLYINADISDLTAYAMAMLDKKMPVWFGCDVGKESSMRKNGIMSTDIFDYELVFNTHTKDMSKSDRLKYNESEMTHAMLFTGYDLSQDGKVPSKWRVENSWGEDRSDKGYDVMTQDWFKEHMYQVVVPKSMLSAAHLALLDTKPIVLPVWDPMGSLASH